MNFEIHNGKIKSFLGAVAMFNFEMHVCVKVDEHHSFWKHKWDEKVFQEKLNLNLIFFQDISSREFFKPWEGERLNNFISDSPAAEIETKQQESTNEEITMAKKATTKKTVKEAATESNGKPGKIAFVDEHLQSGKFTKAEVAEKLTAEFGVPEKTAKNTVSWAASTMKNRTGKVSKHLPKVKADGATEKPVKAKTEKAKKPAKKKAAKVKPTPEPAAV